MAHWYDSLPTIKRLHGYLFAVWLACVIIILVMACVFAYIGGSTGHFTDGDKYWQACVDSGTSFAIPINEVLKALDDNLQIFCASIWPVVHPKLAPLEESPIYLPVSSVTGSLSYTGIQTIMFSTFAFAMLYRAWNHPSWLPSTVIFVIWCTFAILTYYTANPLLPLPTKTNATLMTTLGWATKDNFDAMTGSKCDQAYHIVNFFLAINVIVVILCGLQAVLGTWAEWIRIHSPSRKYYPQLRNTAVPVIIIAVAFVGYICAVSAKVNASFTALHAFSNYTYDAALAATDAAYKSAHFITFPSYLFPFQVGSLDIGTILWILSFMSVIRGYSRQSVSAFRLAAATAALYILTSYPGIVGGVRFYYYNNFDDDESCKNFFLIGTASIKPSIFGYPSEHLAEKYCDDFRLGIAGGLIVFLLMHVQIIAAGYCFTTNMDRPSGIFDTIDPSAEPAKMALRNSLLPNDSLNHGDYEGSKA